MKAVPFANLVLVLFGAALPGAALGQTVVQATPAPTATNVESISSNQTAPAQWSSGVPEILKLSRAGIGEETIVTYIASSGRTYNLSAAEIVRLKEQGISDPVLTAMLQQSQAKTAGAPVPSPQVAPIATTPSSPETSNPQYAPTAAAPASTTYVVPSSPAAYTYPYYDSSYPYYYPYYGYPYPAVSFSFGFGGYYGYPYGHYGGGWHGYHGGGYHGGGYHGGGGHGGHH